MKTNTKDYYLLAIGIILSFSLISCKKDIIEANSGNSSLQKSTIKYKELEGNYTSPKPYNLNIIYFVPTDKHVNDNYEERISGLLFDFQKFVGKWMDKWGYSGQNFGMLTKDANNKYGKAVRIITVYGKYDSSHYGYRGGGGQIISEVKQFFTERPALKTSDHYLVFTPENYDVTAPGAPSANVPFYGMHGYWGFGLDYPGMSLENTCGKGKPGNGWIGGLFHELGHGLGLYHIGETQSENTDYGTALMGLGSRTYCGYPTFLTYADCTLLSKNQLFSDEKLEFYKGGAASLGSINSAKADDSRLTIFGTILTKKDIDKVLFYFVPLSRDEYVAPSAVSNYLEWHEDPTGASYHFSTIINPKDFIIKDDTYDLILRFLHKDGSITYSRYSKVFKLKGGEIMESQVYIPPDTRNKFIKEVIADSEETIHENSLAINTLDKNWDTKWHSKYAYSASPYPHHLTFTFKNTVDIKSIVLLQGNRPPKRYEIYNITGAPEAEVYTKIKEGELPNDSGINVIRFDLSIITDKLQIKFLDSYDGGPYASMAELWFSDH